MGELTRRAEYRAGQERKKHKQRQHKIGRAALLLPVTGAFLVGGLASSGFTFATTTESTPTQTAQLDQSSPVVVSIDSPQSAPTLTTIKTSLDQKERERKEAEQRQREQREAEQRQREQAQRSPVRIPTILPDPNGDVVEMAKQMLGAPYVFGGESESGVDCSGLVQLVYSKVGKTVPRTASAQRVGGTQIPWSEAQPGDVIATNGHAAIYIGNGQLIHAPHPGEVVQIASVGWMQSQGASVVRY